MEKLYIFVEENKKFFFAQIRTYENVIYSAIRFKKLSQFMIKQRKFSSFETLKLGRTSVTFENEFSKFYNRQIATVPIPNA